MKKELFKIGDEVIPTRKFRNADPGWTERMEAYIGKPGKITSISSRGSSYQVHDWYWIPSVLKLVDEVIEFNHDL